MAEWIAKYWLEALFTILLGGFVTAIKIGWSSVKAIKLGLQAMLRNDIIDLYNKVNSRPDHKVKIYEYRNMEELYKQYHALRGNGTVTHLYEEFKQFPISEEVVR